MNTPRGGERRPVTALFADIVGSTSLAERLDPEEWSDILGAGVRRMTEVVTRYDGHVDQILGDGVLAFFGLRVAHEDDPQRAVRAGLEMVAEMRRYSDETERDHGLRLPIRVGINTGPVVVRELGGSAGRTEVTALGDAVNIAARMQSEAGPDQVLITASTHAFVAASVEGRHVGAIALKGKATTVDAFEISAWTGPMARPRGLTGLTSRMIGRDEELQALVGLLPAVGAGLGRAAIVVGEPGMGKSRLIAELQQRVGSDATGIVWHEARCLSYGRTLPYHLAAGITRSLLGGPTPDLAADTATGPISDGPDAGAAHADPDSDPYLAHLLGMPLPDGLLRDVTRLDHAVLQDRYVEALHRLLERSGSEHPRVLVCEDVHWADPASVELLGRLIPLLRGLPVLLLIATRPDRDAAGWWLVVTARERYGDVLVERHLRPLTEADGLMLVGDLLEIDSLGADTRQEILRRADGNPFFIEEIIRMLIDRGAIERRGGRWQATRAVQTGEIPESIHGLLLARIDRLDAGAREVLRSASVIGRRFPAGILTRALVMAGTDVGDVGGALALLERVGMLELVQTEPDLEYHFRHVLIQEAAYESLLRQDRRRLHAIVAACMEEAYVDRLDELAGVIAMHFDAGGEPARAVDHLARAGRFALERHAAHEARDAFLRARALLPDGDVDEGTRRRRAEMDLGAVEAGLSFTPAREDLAVLRRVRDDADALGDTHLLARTLLLIAAVRTTTGEQYQTSPELREALDRGLALTGHGDPAFRADALAILGESRYAAAEYHEAARLLAEAAAVFESDGRTARASLTRGTLGLAYARLGDLAAAEAELTRSDRLAAESGDPTALLDADLMRAIVEGLRGRSDRAIDLATRAAHAADLVDNKACGMVARSVIGEQRLLSGEPAAAIQVLEESAELAEYCHIAPARVEYTRALLESARARCVGPDVVPARLDRALEYAREAGDRLAEGEILRQRARDRLRCGALADARADFVAAAAVFRSVDARLDLVGTLREHAGIARSAGDRVTADALAAEAAAAEEVSARAASGPTRDGRAEPGVRPTG